MWDYNWGWFGLKKNKASRGQQKEVYDLAVQLQNSCSCAPVISSTHVVCAKCYKANIWVKPSGPDPANGRFEENFLFINPLPVSIDVWGGEKRQKATTSFK